MSPRHTLPIIARGIINCTSNEAEAVARDFISKNVLRATVKSKAATKGSIEPNIEVRLIKNNTDFVNALCDINGVTSAVIVSYNGDYMG